MILFTITQHNDGRISLWIKREGRRFDYHFFFDLEFNIYFGLLIWRQVPPLSVYCVKTAKGGEPN